MLCGKLVGVLWILGVLVSTQVKGVKLAIGIGGGALLHIR